MELKPFILNRLEDESGVSGTGLVAVGVMFPSGHCVLEWLVPPRTMGWYENPDDIVAVHGHNGKTMMLWLNGGNIDLDKIGFSMAVRPQQK